ncbi:MAG: AN1-type zinc finger protein [Candidatus Bathyarchaeia archaeon]
MSKETYQIQFNDKKIKINQILTALMEIAKEMDINSKKVMSELEWASENQVSPPNFDVETPIFEATIPDELTKDIGVSKETVRIIPINDKTIQIVITDASLPPTKCQEIAIQFTQQLYKKATGKTLNKKQILLKKTATLQANICEHCLKPLESLPHTCQICGRTFCYDHRRPETHGCQTNIKTKTIGENVLETPRTTTQKTRAYNKPKIVIQKIPCG